MLAIAEALGLSESERHYVLGLIRPAPPDEAEVPDPLLVRTLQAIAFPAYLITAEWNVVGCNAAFLRVWSVEAGELPFNAIERLFLDPRARALHGDPSRTRLAAAIRESG